MLDSNQNDEMSYNKNAYDLNAIVFKPPKKSGRISKNRGLIKDNQSNNM